MKDFDRLLTACRELLSSRYADGEVDAVAMSRFASKVEAVDPATAHIGHKMTEEYPSEVFIPRRGCLDCNVWIDPVRLRDPKS